MRAALVAAIENLLHLQVDLLCKAIPLSLTRPPLSVSHSAWISRREREAGGGYKSWACAAAASHQNCLWFVLLYSALLLPFSNLHFHFNARWQFPFGANSPSPLPLFSSFSPSDHIATRPRAKWTAAANQLTFRFDLKCSNYQHYKRWTASVLAAQRSTVSYARVAWAVEGN